MHPSRQYQLAQSPYDDRQVNHNSHRHPQRYGQANPVHSLAARSGYQAVEYPRLENSSSMQPIHSSRQDHYTQYPTYDQRVRYNSPQNPQRYGQVNPVHSLAAPSGYQAVEYPRLENSSSMQPIHWSRQDHYTQYPTYDQRVWGKSSHHPRCHDRVNHGHYVEARSGNTERPPRPIYPSDMPEGNSIYEHGTQSWAAKTVERRHSVSPRKRRCLRSPAPTRFRSFADRRDPLPNERREKGESVVRRSKTITEVDTPQRRIRCTEKIRLQDIVEERWEPPTGKRQRLPPLNWRKGEKYIRTSDGTIVGKTGFRNLVIEDLSSRAQRN
jgi:hypothetical protein